MKSVQIFENALIESEMSNNAKILVNEMKSEIINLCSLLNIDDNGFNEDEYPEDYFKGLNEGFIV
tara:strand:- start:83 stop:277 length:195 start_codon:yes stop_codon:yes gene_type:complete